MDPDGTMEHHMGHDGTMESHMGHDGTIGIETHMEHDGIMCALKETCLRNPMDLKVAMWKESEGCSSVQYCTILYLQWYYI